jgi:hypothetical protein
MSEETPDAPQKSVLHACVIWLSWVLAAVGFYIFSLGPISRLAYSETLLATFRSDKAFDIYFAPALWAYDNTPLHRPIGMYMSLWLPGFFNSKGERVTH